VIARTLTAAIGHMVDSSIVIYGFILVYFKHVNRRFFTIIFYFLLGAFVHALYDYLLFEQLILFFILSFVFFIQCWMILINNAINNSKYFDYGITFKQDEVKFKIAEYLMFILIVNYLFVGLISGKKEANVQYFISLSYGGLLILFYVSSISSFDLVKGYWRPIRFQFSEPNAEAFPGARGASTLRKIFTSNIIQPLNHVGKKIKLHSPRYNQDLLEIFTIGEGQIVDRLRMIIKSKKKLIEDNNWFLVQLVDPLDISNDFEDKKILIKIKDTFASFLHDEHIKCWVKFIPKGLDPLEQKDISLYLSYGYIMINGEDYDYDLD
jgi:hypothetical protein